MLSDKLLAETLEKCSGLSGQDKVDFLSSMLLFSLIYLEDKLGEDWLDEFIVSARDNPGSVEFIKH